MQPVFLTLEEVLEIHRVQLERYGGAAGIRDLGLLQSAPGSLKPARRCRFAR